MAFVVSQMPRLLLFEGSGNHSLSPFPSPPGRPSTSSTSAFRPGIAVIVGVLTITFSLTFLLLLYAKHCKRGAAGGYAGGAAAEYGASRLPSGGIERRHSGVQRAVVESLPVFRFGSLRGQKEGLECAVCLNRFEPAEALRLLPKCRHGFHLECVDTWLDAHSTCPLCRVRVDPEDVLLVPQPDPEAESKGGEKGRESKGGDGTPKASPFSFLRRMSGRHSSAGERTSNSLQIVVHRANEPAASRYRRSADCSGCDPDSVLAPAMTAPATALSTVLEEPKVRKDGLLPTVAAGPEEREAFERRYSHRIVVSDKDGEDRERWSDLHQSDLFFLRKEMIVTESGRFSSSKLGRASRSSSASCSRGGGNATASGPTTALRCGSEIVGQSRFAAGERPANAAEERTMRRWLGFAASRTGRWIGRREGGNS